ncbi:hypothetical protein ACLKA6_006779 [Drosophila palustris]
MTEVLGTNAGRKRGRVIVQMAAGSGSAANKMAAAPSLRRSFRLLASHFGHFCGAIEQFGLCFASCRRLLIMLMMPAAGATLKATLILCLAGSMAPL